MAEFMGRTVEALELQALEGFIKEGRTGQLCVHSSNRGFFCAYLVLASMNTVYRVSSTFPLKAHLRRLCKAHPNMQLMPS